MEDVMKGLLQQLPKELPASIFVAYHIPPEAGGSRIQEFSTASPWKVKLADDKEPIRRGVIYMARPDRHLLVTKGTVRVTRGPRENRWRPSIDSLFRSAAVSYGSRVIGVVLSGMLDDGAAGLLAIKRCGGIALVQDPDDAKYPQMPRSALANVDVDHCLRSADFGPQLARLLSEPAGPTLAVPPELEAEARVSEHGADLTAEIPGRPTSFVCPECGGPLQAKEDEPGKKRYRCLVGHSWSQKSLLSNSDDALEVAMWAAIRLFRQRAMILTETAGSERTAGRARSATRYDELAEEALGYARRLQSVVLEIPPFAPDDSGSIASNNASPP
jgi:two-component system chemotaxis response regulator CheB